MSRASADAGSRAGLILAVLAESCAIGLLGLSGWFIASSAVAGVSLGSTFSYLAPSGGVRGFALGRVASSYANRVVLHAAALRRTTAARLRFYDQVAATSGASGSWSGESLDLMLADADTGGMALIQSTAPTVIAATVTTTASLVVLLAGYPVTATVVLLTAALCAGLATYAAHGADDGSSSRSEARSELISAVEAWPEMASLGAADQLARRSLDRLDAFEERRLHQSSSQARITALVRTITAIATLLVVASATYSGASLAMLVLLALLTVGVMATVERLVPAAEARKLAAVAVERLDDPGNDSRTAHPALRTTYDRDGVTMSGYWLPDTPTRSGRMLDLQVPRGGMLIACGTSGSGKSTLLTAIELALRAQSSAVVTAVLADDYTFTGTIADNIRLAEPAATDGEIRDLLASMALAVEPSTNIGVGGRQLSGGEQRRLHIARAVVTRPDVLIVDEPSAGLDSRTAAIVLATIRDRLPHAVVILATHVPPAELLAAGASIVSLE